MKLSPSALSLFLRSPKAYFWRYVARLDPIMPSVATFDHDKIFGTLWAEFVDRFYQGQEEEANRFLTLERWHEQTQGWVPEKAKGRLTTALETLMPQYYRTFSPTDGMRVESEKWVSDDLFIGRLDGLGKGVVHEVKSTSRSPIISEQLWKVQNSLQVKLYCVLTEAKAHCIEFAFKDAPYSLYRGPLVDVSEEQRNGWRQELTALAAYVQSLGDDSNNYVCHPDGCCLTTRGTVSMCPYQALCTWGLTEQTAIYYKEREARQPPIPINIDDTRKG